MSNTQTHIHKPQNIGNYKPHVMLYTAVSNTQTHIHRPQNIGNYKPHVMLYTAVYNNVDSTCKCCSNQAGRHHITQHKTGHNPTTMPQCQVKCKMIIFYSSAVLSNLQMIYYKCSVQRCRLCQQPAAGDHASE